ncbi:ATP-binding cassette domain-containing protein, partial [Staphylococcus aureus]|uniref:ATP-binding cassette domain-containing protein n=1 Tax=Staphylococcus aureus TaxID=1280 RepID=UPI0035A158CD
MEVITPLAIALPAAGLPANRWLLAFEDAGLVRGERVFGPWRFEIVGPERVAVTGPNGAGKTSLLRMAAGQSAPDRGTGGGGGGGGGGARQQGGARGPGGAGGGEFPRGAG